MVKLFIFSTNSMTKITQSYGLFMRINKKATLFSLTIAALAFGQIDPTIETRLETRSHTYQETTLPYRLYIPDDYSVDKAYPLLLFLHGAMWAGTDNKKQLDNELALYWIDSTRQAIHPCFVVYPQIPGGTSWEKTAGEIADFPPSPELATANDIVTSLISEFSIDINRLYLCGKSIGGLGVYGMAARYPNRYAAVVPAAGSYLYRSLENLAQLSLWIFHNKYDNTVQVDQSRHVVTELEKIGINFVLTHCDFKTDNCKVMPEDSIKKAIQGGARYFYSEFDDSGHQLEPNVVATFGLYEWLVTQSRVNAGVGSFEQNLNFSVVQNYPNPFNENTLFSFDLHQGMSVKLEIYNAKGQLVSTLTNGWQGSGRHTYYWYAAKNPSGVYFYQLSSPSGAKRGRCLLLR